MLDPSLRNIRARLDLPPYYISGGWPPEPPLKEASDLAAPCRAAFGERTRTMETVIAAAVLAAGLVIAALLLVKRAPGLAAAGTARSSARPASAPANKEAAKNETDDALARRQEIGRMEERLVSREVAIETRIAELDEREARPGPRPGEGRGPP